MIEKMERKKWHITDSLRYISFRKIHIETPRIKKLIPYPNIVVPGKFLWIPKAYILQNKDSCIKPMNYCIL